MVRIRKDAKIHKAKNISRTEFACGILNSVAPSRRGWLAVTCKNCLKHERKQKN